GLHDELLFFLNNAVWRLRRTFLPYHLNEFCTLLAQNSLHTTNGVALAIQQMSNSAEEIDIVRAIVAPAAAAFHRLDLVEAALPKAQHVLRQIAITPPSPLRRHNARAPL